MSVVIIPHRSWTILLNTMVDPTTWGWACFQGSLMVVWVELSSHKDLVILAKLGGGICFHATGLPGGVFTHCVKMLGAPVPWPEAARVFTVEGMMSFDQPLPLVGPMSLALVLQFLLLLCSSGGEGWRVSMNLEGVTHTQFEGFTSSNTWASVKVVNGLHPLPSIL